MTTIRSFFVLLFLLTSPSGYSADNPVRNCSESDILIDSAALTVKQVSGEPGRLAVHFDFPTQINGASFEYLYLEDAGDDDVPEFSATLLTWPMADRLEARIEGTEEKLRQYSLSAMYIGNPKEGSCGALAKLELAGNAAIAEHLACANTRGGLKCSMDRELGKGDVGE